MRNHTGGSIVNTILINIFGGITRCDEVAKGVIHALSEQSREIPIIARLVGTNSQAGIKLLNEAGITTLTTLTETAHAAVERSLGRIS